MNTGSEIPYSVAGSFFTISAVGGEVMLRNISGDAPSKEILAIQLKGPDGYMQPAVSHRGCILHLENGPVGADACFEGANSIRLRSEGTTFKLLFKGDIETGCCNEIGPGRWLVAYPSSRVNIVFQALKGSLAVQYPTMEKGETRSEIMAQPDASNQCEVVVEMYQKGYQTRQEHPASFEQCAATLQAEFEKFLKSTVVIPERYSRSRELAAYLNWSSLVPPEGLIKRIGMYMSKNWMCNIWSWDHCFNALALSYENPALAWDQFMVMFDAQDQTGAIPDCINNCNAIWQFCKPPVHGWTLGKMLSNNTYFTIKHIRQVYGPLCRWTNWWFEYRDSDGDGVPEYHHGNDSGWDNATVFTAGSPVESPDLAALLIIQMDVLSDLAAKLELGTESAEWKQRAAKLMENFIEHFVVGEDKLTPRISGTHRPIRCESLLPYISLVLGKRLPNKVMSWAIENLKQSGLITAYGLATEPPHSPYYCDDGYWRGPIWAPSTLLMVDGLQACGEYELSEETAIKFIELCNEHGFAENFDARTGKSLRDPAYTWTSSVFLVLAHEYMA